MAWGPTSIRVALARIGASAPQTRAILMAEAALRGQLIASTTTRSGSCA